MNYPDVVSWRRRSVRLGEKLLRVGSAQGCVCRTLLSADVIAPRGYPC